MTERFLPPPGETSVPPESSGFDTVLAFFQALSSFAILVGVASLAFAAWAYRRNRRATDVQGLTLDIGESHVVTMIEGKLPTTDFSPRATATGPGVRFSARTQFWVDDKRMASEKWDMDVRGRFDLDSEPLSSKVTIPVELAPRVWFGVAWDAVAGRGIRTEFVRVNVKTRELQSWRWRRFVRLHRWWCEQAWLRPLGGGTRRQAGRWKTIPSDRTAEWQFPT